MKLITKESEAWREVARRIEQRGVEYGICRFLRALAHEGMLAWDVKDDMDYRIRAGLDEREELGEKYTAYLWSEGGCEDERILYCLFMAELAEDEGR